MLKRIANALSVFSRAREGLAAVEFGLIAPVMVIMLLGTDALPVSKELPWQRPLAFVLALVMAAESIYLFFIRKAASGVIPQPVETFGSPKEIGVALFSQYLLPFEITSILLLVAMVGAIVLTQKEKK